MNAFLRRLVDAVLGIPPRTPAADDALEALRRANRIATQYRQAQDRRTGNPTADMITGTYRPAKRSER